MILSELVGHNEDHPAYRSMEVANGMRHYGFLRSAIEAALAVERPFLSQTLIKAINYHAIACLHPYAGEYRPCPVTVGEYEPPAHYRVGTLMDDFVNQINRNWHEAGEVSLAAHVLWRLNWIHPFINGNGRTARAACYFVLCLKMGGWLPGNVILPEALRQSEVRKRYIQALRHADDTAQAGALDLEPMAELLLDLLGRQLASIDPKGEPR